MFSSNKFFIYGVPGSGKTYYSKKFGKQLNIPVIEGDKIKNKARKGKSKKENPFFYLGTCQAYRQFGKLNRQNAINGLLAVRKVFVESIFAEIKNFNDGFVLEGAFLDPNELHDFGKPILLVTLDEKRHRKQFLHHREKLLDIANSEFKSARIIQKYLITEAKHLNIQIVENK